ncbi:hypothetical protein JCM10449v2_001669 [Rhodotorula kratochvilovae]
MASTRNPQPAGSAAASRLSLASEAPSTSAPPTGRTTPVVQGIAESKYSITAVLAEPQHQGGLLPSLPALPSASSYLPAQLSSLSTTFTSAGTLPRSAAPGAKSVAQRRSQAPPIQVTELRRVNRSELDGYLREVGDDFERWQRESQAGREGAADLREGDEALSAAEGEEMVGLGIGGEGRARTASRTPAMPPPRTGKPEEILPSLDDVPQIFFDASFDLANPRTFDLVTERIQLSPHPSPNLSLPAEPSSSAAPSSLEAIPGLGPHTLNALAADQVLQDKLSHYTAVIESHLVREIGLRSSSFFAALSNLQSLHQEGEAALHKITELQAALAASEGGVGAAAQHGLQILRAQARRRGLERIEEAVRAVEEVWTAVEGVKELVENGEWDGALEVSEQIEEAYFGSSSSGAGADDASSSSSSTLTSALSPAKPPAARRAPARPLNLTKLRALSPLPAKLALLRAQIAKSLEGELISVLEHEMDVGIDEHVRLGREGRRWKGKGRAADAPPHTGAPGRALQDVPEEDGGEGEEPPAPEDAARERTLERVRPVVAALVRAEGMDSAVTAWRESVLREVRALVREHLPTAETPTAEEEDHFAQVAVRSVSRGASVDLGTISEKSVSLAKKLRALPHEAFVGLARETYAGLLACIEVVDLHARVLLALWTASRHAEHARKAPRRGRQAGAEEQARPAATSNASLVVPGSAADLVASAAAATAPVDSSRSSTSDDASTLATEITDVVHAVAELANVRFSKVIGVRTEVHAQLALAEFVEIFDLSWQFVVQCEVVCQRMIVGLRGAMVSQAKTFLQAFHQRQITENARVVEEEQWAAAEVPPETQANVKLIIDGATTDPTELLLGARRLAREENGGQHEGADAAATEPAKQVDVEGRQFFAVSAGLVTIAVLVEYLKVLVNVPMLTTDAMSKIIEFMKVFNSRTCQVVLGAGAMRSAGLKNITAKHLALASQALSIMISLIPYIREAVRRHLNPKQAVMLTEFDKLKRDYQEHQHEIHAKLVAIMSDRLQVHSRTLEGVNFEEPAPRGVDAPNAYMEALVKEHNTLHKVLSRFLATETVASIMSQVFGALDARLTEVFARLEPRSHGAKERMLVDVRYLRERLGELKGVEENGPGRALEALVAAKPLPQAPAPPAPAPAPAPAIASRPSLPPRTSSIAPSSPSLSASTAPTPSHAPHGTPRASTSSTSLSSAPAPALAPQPPSPVPVPAPLPPSPKPAGPAPYVSKKKKTLAERLAESMGRAAKAEPAPAQSRPSEDAPPAPTRLTEDAPAAPQAEELTPLALERALESGAGVDTPALEQALRLDGFDGAGAAAKEELEEVEKAVERELAPSVDAADVPEEASIQPAAEAEGAPAQVADEQEVTPVEANGAADASVVPADDALAEHPAGPLAEESVEAREPAVELRADPVEGAVPASDDPITDAPVEEAHDEPAAAPAEEASADEPPHAFVAVDAPPASSPADALMPIDELSAPASHDAEPAAPASTDAPPAEFGETVEETQTGPAENDDESLKGGSLVEIADPSHAEPALPTPAPVVAAGPEDAVDGALTAQDEASVPSPAPAPPVDAAEEALAPPVPVVEVDPPAPSPTAAAEPTAADEETAAAKEPAPAPSPAPAAAPAPAPSPAPAAVEIAPSPAPAPASSPSPVGSAPSPSPSPSPAAPAAAAAADPAPAPTRRKTLKERLAEAARRGSSGSASGSSMISPPVSPVGGAFSPPALVASVVGVLGNANGIGKEEKEEEGKGLVASPEAAAVQLPALATAATKKEEANGPAGAKEADAAARETAEDAPVVEEEEESTFL